VYLDSPPVVSEISPARFRVDLAGLLSRTLAVHCASITGADINPVAVSRYNARSAQQGLDASEMRAVLVSKLSSPAAEGHDGDKFDVVACNMAYHHIADIALMTRELAQRVKPGGALFVSDLLKEELAHSPSGGGRLLHVGGPIHLHAPGSTVEHPDGLSMAEVRIAFEAAGLEDIDVEVVHSVQGGAGVWHVFLASGWIPEGTNLTEGVVDTDRQS